MTRLFTPLIAKILGGISIVLLIGLAVQSWRASHWQGAYAKLHGEGVEIVSALSRAVGRKVAWGNAPEQVRMLGETVALQRAAIAVTNERIDAMAAEAVRLRARADQLRAIAERAEAQRAAALRTLGDMRATPGTRADCRQLLREAEEALDIVREASAMGDGE